MLNVIAEKNLIWLPEKGIGYYPVKDFPYNEDYFQKYEKYAMTDLGFKITEARINFVARHWSGELVDVGVGSGQFIRARGGAKGFDVNPSGKQWLEQSGLWCDIYNGHICQALTFWDSLEHIEDIVSAVSRAKKFIFVSIPIFENCEHILRSKHFRKDEHFWYFTDEGFVRWMSEQGFDLLERNKMEQDFGREDIFSYAFRRRDA